MKECEERLLRVPPNDVLIIAEKQSVARDLSKEVKATSRGNGYFHGNGYVEGEVRPNHRLIVSGRLVVRLNGFYLVNLTVPS